MSKSEMYSDVSIPIVDRIEPSNGPNQPDQVISRIICISAMSKPHLTEAYSPRTPTTVYVGDNPWPKFWFLKSIGAFWRNLQGFFAQSMQTGCHLCMIRTPQLTPQ